MGFRVFAGLFFLAAGIAAILLFRPQKPNTQSTPLPVFAAASPTPVFTTTPSPTKAAKIIPTTAPQVNSTNGWHLTVYYTPVEKYHSGEQEHVPGVGSFSKAFLDLVRLEGVGKISNGPHAGRYLQRGGENGFYIVDSPLDARGGALVAFKSAAMTESTNFGTKIKIVSCGGAPAIVCNKIKSAEWEVVDRFGYDAGSRHIDLYIGEENSENFLASELVFEAKNAEVTIY